MNKFKKLNREEMKKINGGGEHVCNISNTCYAYAWGIGYTNGSCSIPAPNSCKCTGVYDINGDNTGPTVFYDYDELSVSGCYDAA